MADKEGEEEGETFRFSNALCSARLRCLSATGARMMWAQSNDSARSLLLCNVGAGEGEGVATSVRADVDVDTDVDPKCRWREQIKTT